MRNPDKTKKNTNDHQASNLFDPQSNPSPEQGLPLKSTNVKRTETWKIPMVQVETCQPNETPAYMRQSLLNSPLAISKKKKNNLFSSRLNSTVDTSVDHGEAEEHKVTATEVSRLTIHNDRGVVSVRVSSD